MPGNVTQAMDTSTNFPQTSLEEIPFTLEDFDMTTLDIISEAEMLATMQAIKNPAWWSTGLMPGYVLLLSKECMECLLLVAGFHGLRAHHLLGLMYHPLFLSKMVMALYQLRDSWLHSGMSSKERRLFKE
jgi:hypothetical protein